MHQLLITATIFITFLACNTFAVIVECDYTDWHVPDATEDSIYTCSVVNSEIFRGKRVTVDGVVGEHIEGRDSSQVRGFSADGTTNMNKLPTNIDKAFPELIALRVDELQLAKITRRDLRPFTKLKYLWLQWNRIRVIRADTFAFNGDLEVIQLYGNRLEHIDAGAFEHLDKLRSLDFRTNTHCYLLGAFYGREEVLKAIEFIDSNECVSEEFLTTTTQDPRREALKECAAKSQKLVGENDLKYEKIDESRRKIHELKNETAMFSVEIESLVDNLRQKEQEVGNLITKVTKSMNKVTELKDRLQKMISKNETVKNLRKMLAQLVEKSKNKQDAQISTEISDLIDSKVHCEAKVAKLAVVLKASEVKRSLLENCNGQMEMVRSLVILKKTEAEKCMSASSLSI